MRPIFCHLDHPKQPTFAVKESNLQMKTLTSKALRYEYCQSTEKWRVNLLIQTNLPHTIEWRHCSSASQMVEIIQSLQIRGAPLIGVGASLLLGHLTSEGLKGQDFYKTAKQLSDARPTAVNLQYCIQRLIHSYENNGPEAVLPEAIRIFEEDQALCQAIGNAGADLLKDGDNVLTHCNAGALATAGIGTAIGVIDTAWQQGKQLHIYVDETRPLLQGARLTAWELQQANIPCTLICDNMAASLMREGKIQKIVVGADRIAANGDFANKIGTYNLAVLAKHHGIPFYVAAPYTTIDRSCLNGAAIPIEQRKGNEVTGFGNSHWAPMNISTHNPAFDVTPAELVTGWILDTGVITDLATL